jgi:hypothetical protein
MATVRTIGQNTGIYCGYVHLQFDDEVLLNIFHHCRASLSDEHEVDSNSNVHDSAGRPWRNERWWYKLVHICRRWRHVVFKSASHLRLCLFCTYGTPIADMLTYSPTLPITIDYGDKNCQVTTQDKEGVDFVLWRRHSRVRRI